MKWYRRASKYENPDALGAIGQLFVEGNGVKQDVGEAIRWWQRASAAGSRWARESIALAFYDGIDKAPNRQKAFAIFRLSYNTNPDDYVAMRIWQCQATQGITDGARAFVVAHIKKYKPTGWALAVLRTIADDMTNADLLDLARKKSEKQAMTVPQRLCEAHFYIGCKLLFSGDKKAAIEQFEKCVATGVDDYIEHRSAQYELKRLKS